MSKIMAWCMGLALAGALAGCGQSAVVPAAGSGGRAIEVPGLGALSMGRDAEVISVSCGSAGSCAAGGAYEDRHGDQGFVAVERHGRWGTAIGVPGLGALNTGGDGEVGSVSCAAAGTCAAGGFYSDRRGVEHGFVAAGRDGVWGRAIKVPGPVSSVSCPSAGYCAAVGIYSARRGHFPMFVVSLRHGRWGTAVEVPGRGTLDNGGVAVISVSCGSAGSCAAGGDYTDRRGIGQGFVAVERGGRWGTAIEVPGLGALNKGGDTENQLSAEVQSVSCGAAGSCAAGGGYWDSRGQSQGFVVSLRHGHWGKAIEVPGLGGLSKGWDAWVFSVSCGPAGTCAAGGYDDSSGFVAVERDGRWGTATGVPGLAALDKGGFAAVISVSCGPAGSCAAGGDYTDRSQHSQGFVAVERDGRWGTATGVPGLGALNAGGQAGVSSLSCGPAGTCVAGGSYWDRHHRSHGYVASQT
jgi:hypothetical protein